MYTQQCHCTMYTPVFFYPSLSIYLKDLLYTIMDNLTNIILLY